MGTARATPAARARGAGRSGRGPLFRAASGRTGRTGGARRSPPALTPPASRRPAPGRWDAARASAATARPTPSAGASDQPEPLRLGGAPLRGARPSTPNHEPGATGAPALGAETARARAALPGERGEGHTDGAAWPSSWPVAPLRRGRARGGAGARRAALPTGHTSGPDAGPARFGGHSGQDGQRGAVASGHQGAPRPGRTTIRAGRRSGRPGRAGGRKVGTARGAHLDGPPGPPGRTGELAEGAGRRA